MVYDKRLDDICSGYISPANITMDEIDSIIEDLTFYLDRLEYVKRHRELVEAGLETDD